MATNKTAKELNIFVGSTLGDCLKVESFLGEGGFGFVTKCCNTKTNEKVAVKVNKNDPEIVQQAKVEIDMLKKLRRLDPSTSHIVKWNGFFFDKTHICLSFELLDQSLHYYIREQYNLGLPMSEMKPVLYQLATALSHLSSIGIIHADLKPENVMVVNRHQKPLQVKVIDFGLARPVSDPTRDSFVQTIWYKAPEVIIYAPFNEAIDMWTLGLIAAEMVTGCTLYPGNSVYDVLRFIIQTQGQPPDDVLYSGAYTDHYFELAQEENGEEYWRFKPPEEYETGRHTRDTRYIKLENLDDLEQVMKIRRGHHDDQHLLVTLIKSMMHLDANQRIKPREVLKHPFFASILPQSSCADTNNNIMDTLDKNLQVCQQQPSEDNTNGRDNYIVGDIIGQGGFGVVWKCHNKKTNQPVVVKVNQNNPGTVKQAKLEISILKQLRCLDPDTCNIVKWNGFFFDWEQICLEFELLDQSLHYYIQEQCKQCLCMTEVKSVIQQLATALSHLSSIGIIHADLKPDNVMVVNRHQKPLKVKLIDFGLAHPVSAATPGVCVQTIYYRAPEIILGIPYSEAIDMWSLGLTAVEMITGYPLYSGQIDYDVLRFIIDTQGQPADHILHRGIATGYFFQVDDNSSQRYWRLKTPGEFEYDTGLQAKDTRLFRLNSLDDLEQLMKTGHHDDHHLLVSLIKRMLHLDATRRIKPLEVLNHPLFASGKDICQQITEPGNPEPRIQSSTSFLGYTQGENTEDPNFQNDYLEDNLLWSRSLSFFANQSSSENTYNDMDYEDGQVILEPFCLPIIEPRNPESRVQSLISFLGYTQWENTEDPNFQNDYLEDNLLWSRSLSFFANQSSSENTYNDMDYEDGQVILEPFCLPIIEPRNPESQVQSSNSFLGYTQGENAEDPNFQNDYLEDNLLWSRSLSFFANQSSSENTYNDMDYEDGQVILEPFCLPIIEPRNPESRVQSSNSFLGYTQGENAEDPNFQNDYLEDNLLWSRSLSFFANQSSSENTYNDMDNEDGQVNLQPFCLQIIEQQRRRDHPV